MALAAFNDLGNHRAVLQRSYAISRPTSEWPGSRPHVLLATNFLVSDSAAVLGGARRYLAVVWGHISRVTKQIAEHRVCTFEEMIRSQRLQQLLPGRGMSG